MSKTPPIDFAVIKRAFLGVGFLRFCVLFLNFIWGVILARSLGLEAFGLYVGVMVFVPIHSLLLSAGMGTYYAKKVAEVNALGTTTSVTVLVRKAITWITTISLLSFVVLFLFEHYVSTNVDLMDMGSCVLVLSFFNALFALRGGILKGLGKPQLSEISTQLLPPLFSILAVSALLISGQELTIFAIFSSQIFGAIMAHLIFLFVIIRKVPEYPRLTCAPVVLDLEWIKNVLPFASITVVTTLAANISVIALTFIGDYSSVGAYRIADRLSMFVLLPLTLLNMTITPQIVQLHRSRDLGGLERLLRSVARLGTFTSGLIGCCLAILGIQIIDWIFGAEFSSTAYPPMLILVTGYVFAVYLGPVGDALTLTGGESKVLFEMCLGIGIQVLLVIYMSLTVGVLGVALSHIMGLAWWKLRLSTSLKRDRGIICRAF